MVTSTIFKTFVFLGIMGALALAILVYGRSYPENVPWTTLDLNRPVGTFTGRKLARLTGDPELCRTLLNDADIQFERLPDRNDGPACGYRDGTRLLETGSQTIGYMPAELDTSCAVSAALVIWQREVVQPKAQELLGQQVARIEHLGSYNCRRINGANEGQWSEHATADAVDIAAFILEDGTRISIINSWNGEGDQSAFLHQIRDGACDLFATVLSPDYNAAHADHFHMDQAERGAYGWRGCR